MGTMKASGQKAPGRCSTSEPQPATTHYHPTSLSCSPHGFMAPLLPACHGTQSPGYSSARWLSVRATSEPKLTQEFGLRSPLVTGPSSAACTLYRVNTHACRLHAYPHACVSTHPQPSLKAGRSLWTATTFREQVYTGFISLEPVHTGFPMTGEHS